jgi:crotonobetainyl-CoA hydratase
MLTATRISAQEAYNLGLANEIVPLGKLIETAEKWAHQILEAAPLSVRLSKQMSYVGLETSLPNAIKGTYSEEKKWVNSEDRKEGPLAFSEKRTPNWQAK